MSMLSRTLMRYVMRKVGSVPQHDILPEYRLAIYPLADLGIGTVSDLATRRDEFASIIASGGADGLIKRLRDRTQTLLGG